MYQQLNLGRPSFSEKRIAPPQMYRVVVFISKTALHCRLSDSPHSRIIDNWKFDRHLFFVEELFQNEIF